MRTFVLYIHTNKINNKKYVGITSQYPAEKRFSNGNGYVGCSKFWDAIQEYGWDNFSTEIVLENLNEDDAYIKEIEYIEKYQTRNPEFGYNISKGGNRVPSSQNEWLYDGKFPEYTGISVKELCKKFNLVYSAICVCVFKRHHSVDEALGLVPKKIHRYRMYYCGEFEEYNGKTITELCKEFGLKRETVVGRIKQSGWSHDEALELVECDKIRPRLYGPSGKKFGVKRKTTDRYIYRGRVEEYFDTPICEICEELSLNYETVKHRIYFSGWTQDEALEFDPPPNKKGRSNFLKNFYHGSKKEYDGMPIFDIVKKIGLNYSTVNDRINRLHWTQDEALEFIPRIINRPKKSK